MSATIRRDQPAAANPVTWKTVLRIVLSVLVLPAILFISAWRLDWWMGWAYTATAVASVVIGRLLLLRRFPDLFVERAQAASGEGVKKWDKVLVPLVVFGGPIIVYVVAGLDFRFGWSPRMVLAAQLVALLCMALGTALGSWAMLTNRFFSGYVRIQTDRGHTVVAGGPYSYVRHPGYLGGIVTWLATPLALGSQWALIAAALVVGMIVVRTALEDRTLIEELPGYCQYAQHTRYRLIPGVW